MSEAILNRWNSSEIAPAVVGETLRQAVERIVASRADLREANLRGASLSEADLSGASLSEADLSEADLSDATLSEADLSDATLSEANLRCRQYVCRIQGRRHGIIVVNDDVRIGRKRMPLSDWLMRYKVVGKEENYTPFEIAEYGAHLRHIAEVLAIWKTATENVDGGEVETNG